MANLLGIDIGTSGCRVLVIDERGSIKKSATAEYPLSIPKPNWSEQNPEDWWAGVLECFDKIGNVAVDAIGLSGQMHGSVFLDSKNEVIRPAILWNDQRTLAECRQIDRIVGERRVRENTSNPPRTGFQLPKVLWLRNEEPLNFERVSKVLLPKDYIRFRLTGEFYTEVSDASGTGIFDVPNRRWSNEMLDRLQLPEDFFPEVGESFVATTRTQAGLPLPAGIPVVGGGGDQAAGAVGTGAVEPGIVSISLGTSGVVFTSLATPDFDPKGSVHTFCHANGAWHAMGVMLACGGAIRWVRDQFGRGKSYDELAKLAAQAAPGSSGLSFLPYLTGERSPHNDPQASAVWAGARPEHGPAEFVRSVFEGATFGLLDCFDALHSLGAGKGEVRVTGGGASNPFWVQMISDVFECPCTTLESDEGPAFGAAILAGVGVGVFTDVESASRATVRKERTYTHSGSNYARSYQKYRELYSCVKPWNLS